MKRLLFVPLAAALLASTALAQTVTKESSSVTWSADQGTVIREHATKQSYKSFADPSLQPRVGVVLPNTIELYPLPDTLKVPQAQSYSYSIINERPVVVEQSTRKIIHTW